MTQALSAQKLIKSTLYMLSSAGGALALSLGSTLLLAYYLSPKELGILVSAEAFVGLFSLFFEFGFKNSIIKFASESKDNKDALNSAVGNALFIKVLISLPLIALIYFASSFMHFDELTQYILLCYILIFTSDNFAKIFGIVRRTLGQFKLMAVVNLVNPLIRVLAIFLVLQYLGDLKLLVHCFLALSIFRFLLSFLSTIKFVQAKIDLKQLKTMFKESSKFGLFDFLEDLQTRIDRVMISYFLGPASVAFYALPAKINRVVKIIPRTISQVFLPTLHKQYDNSLEDFTKTTKSLSKYIAIIGALLFMTIYYFSEPLLFKLYGDKFADSFQIVKLFAFVSFFWILNSSTGLILATKSAHTARLNSQIIFTIINIALNLYLIPKWGIVGAVYATMISNLIKLMIFSFITRRDTDNIKILLLLILPILLSYSVTVIYAFIIFIAALFIFKIIDLDEIISLNKIKSVKQNHN